MGRWRSVVHWTREAAASYRTALDDAVVAPVQEVALRILADRYGGVVEAGPPPERGRPVFELADFQEAAVHRAVRILEQRRGVVVADSVGFGKTYVALALIERVVRRGGRVAVFTPAALRREWRTPLRRLSHRLGLRDTYGVGVATIAPSTSPPTSGPATAPDRTPAPTPALLAWLSHERLSRGRYPHTRLSELDLVVVDEAHAFRSPGTRRYRALAELCRGADVVLLTATPVNNSVWDLYFQLRLFAGNAAFRDVGVPDLREAFRAAAESGGGPSPPSLMPVLREVVIRRTRAFLGERYGSVRMPGRRAPVSFPRRAPPIPVRYTLDLPLPVDRLVQELERLTLAAVGLHAEGVAALVRLGLLKRLESSVAAFRASLHRQLRFHDAFLDALGRGRLLGPADHRALYTDPGDGDVVQLVLEEVALREPPPGLDLERLRADVESDRARLARLQAGTDTSASGGAGANGGVRASGVSDATDAKVARLISLLDHELRGAKVLVFTEFRDTARHLWRTLVHRGHVALVDGDGAFLGTRPSGRRAVIDRFAPRANRVRPPPDHERVDVLIATDVLAEGLNLQDADRVVSYDLPWNPVRLIQRVGRIDRLGSPHDVVHAYNFLPDRSLERALRLVDRLRGKLTAIGRTVGEEAGVLRGDRGDGDRARDRARDREGDRAGAMAGGEGLGYAGLIDRIAAGDADALDGIERADAAPFEVEERLWTAYEGAYAAGRVTSSTGARPVVGCALAPEARRHRVLVAHRVGGRPLWSVVALDGGGGGGETVEEHPGAAAEVLLAAVEQPTSGAVEPDPGAIERALTAARPLVAERIAALGLADPLSRNSAGAVAARRLLTALAAVPGGPDAALGARADAVLAAVARPRAAGTDTAIRTAVAGVDPRAQGTARVLALLDALERVLGIAHRPAAARSNGSGASDAGQGALDHGTVSPGSMDERATTSPPLPPETRLVGVIEVRPARG